jgi:hypothetical protein
VPQPLSSSPHPAIPRVMCPRCATAMRLAEIVPDIDDREITKFECDCGFTYAMSPFARDEKRRQRPPAA